MNAWVLENFPVRGSEKLRFNDLDRNGHVNNAVYSTLLEAGRLGVFGPNNDRDVESGKGFVVARLIIDFKREMHWPGTVEVGTGVKSIGTTSVSFVQGLFQQALCAATAEVVQVYVDRGSGRPTAIGPGLRERLSALAMTNMGVATRR